MADDERSPVTTRAEHMAWAKVRALQYVEMGDNAQALASLASDLASHPDTAPAVEFISMVGMPLMLMGQLDTAEQMRNWIKGFA